MSKNPVVMAIIDKNRQEDPRLTLILEEIKRNMDTQIEIARMELRETRQIKAETDLIPLNEGDKWSKYETMSYASGAQELRWLRARSVEEQLDQIAAEG